MSKHVRKSRFIRRISAVSNAIETIDNEMICFIIYCLNCIRHGRNATYERDLTLQSISRYVAILAVCIVIKIVISNYFPEIFDVIFLGI